VDGSHHAVRLLADQSSLLVVDTWFVCAQSYSAGVAGLFCLPCSGISIVFLDFNTNRIFISKLLE